MNKFDEIYGKVLQDQRLYWLSVEGKFFPQVKSSNFAKHLRTVAVSIDH